MTPAWGLTRCSLLVLTRQGTTEVGDARKPLAKLDSSLRNPMFSVVERGEGATMRRHRRPYGPIQRLMSHSLPAGFIAPCLSRLKGSAQRQGVAARDQARWFPRYRAKSERARKAGWPSKRSDPTSLEKAMDIAARLPPSF
jgi:hypothetical protein